jgi:hypothetical protein
MGTTWTCSMRSSSCPSLSETSSSLTMNAPCKKVVFTYSALCYSLLIFSRCIGWFLWYLIVLLLLFTIDWRLILVRTNHYNCYTIFLDVMILSYRSIRPDYNGLIYSNGCTSL